MYKFVLSLAFLAFPCFAGTGTSVVTNTPLCVAAMVPSYAWAGLPVWAPTNVYSAGMVVRVGGAPALCVVSGTSSNISPGIAGPDVVDGTVTWRSVSGARQTLAVSNTGGSTVYLAPTAVPGGGLALPAGASIVFSEGAAQMQRLWLSTVSGLSTNNIVEW